MIQRKYAVVTLITFMIAALLAACSGGGGGGTAPAAAASIVPRYAYVANNSDNTVSKYTVNAATGQLRANGYVAAGTRPFSVTVDPSGKYAYVANYTSNNVSAYTLGAGGALAAVAGSPFAAGTNPASVTTTGTIQ